ncbi:hypothetical protein H9P43_009009 [Blastocladiella emersonii ATCC 22665]|nr:hypothetical protein H9P43_008980 [Blastocladiella emersonii ATCC 22665]KAI9155899.1 hypothetical protein H9P43_009009 [Blastocladiella emersonii ATCC 22665]
MARRSRSNARRSRQPPSERICPSLLSPRARETLEQLKIAYPAFDISIYANGSLVLESTEDGSRPIVCPACDMDFKRSNDLARHFHTSHASGTLPFGCVAGCTRRTNRRDHFLEHLRRNPASCALTILLELARDTTAEGQPDRDEDLMSTMLALFPVSQPEELSGDEYLPRLVHELGAKELNSALEDLTEDEVPDGLPFPLTVGL